jgi:RNA polymerase sigma-70 factor (ECF subfamily)
MNEEDMKEADAFYDAEQERLLGFIRKMGLDTHDAEEVLNDAFVAICAHWSEIRDGSPRGYLYRAARNEVFKRWRISGRRPEEFFDPSAVTTGEFAQQVADHEALRRALDTLAEREREAVLLLHYAGFDVAQAALLMGGITPGAVKRYAFDGRRKLKRALAGGTGSDTRKEGT